MAYDLTEKFTLDAEEVGAWLDAIVANDGWTPEENLVGMSADWYPMDDEYGLSVDRLISAAQEEEVIKAPEGMTVYFDYDANEDGGYYGWLLEIEGELRLSAGAGRMIDLTTYGLRGKDAALEILHDAITYANALLSDLQRFVTTNAKVTVHVPLYDENVSVIEVAGVAPENVSAWLYDYDYTGADESEYTDMGDGMQAYVDTLAVKAIVEPKAEGE